MTVTKLINPVQEANKIAKRLASLTDSNDHTGSLILICKTFGFAGSQEELEAIKRQHIKLGYMTDKLMDARRGIYNHILKLVKEASEEAYTIIHGSL